jgi:hypothetical protein
MVAVKQKLAVSLEETAKGPVIRSIVASDADNLKAVSLSYERARRPSLFGTVGCVRTDAGAKARLILEGLTRR